MNGVCRFNKLCEVRRVKGAENVDLHRGVVHKMEALGVNISGSLAMLNAANTAARLVLLAVR